MMPWAKKTEVPAFEQMTSVGLAVYRLALHFGLLGGVQQHAIY
jgi:hypothetical protein